MFSAKKFFIQNVTGENPPEPVSPYVEFDVQPQSQVVSSNSVSFSAQARSVPNGLPLTYQWYRLPKSSGDLVILSGETSSSLNVSGINESTNNGDSYRIKVSIGGEYNRSFSSSAATIYFNGSSLASGGLFSCGLGNQQALGDGTSSSRNWIVRIMDGTFSMVSAGSRHGFGLKSNGELWGWGNSQQSVGLGAWGGAVSSPQRVGAETWSKVSAGGDHTIAIKSDGTLWGWGLSSEDDGRAPYGNEPVLINSDSWSSVSTGGSVGQGHSLAIKSDGTLWSWGLNDRGQLGLGDTSNRNTPTKIGSDSWQKVAGGYAHTLGIKSDGTLWAWGYNFAGQIGDNTTVDKNSPVLIDGGSWTEISAGISNSLAIKSDGTLWSWGYRIGDGSSENRSYVPKKIGSDSWSKIAAMAFGAAAIKQDGTLWSWGDNVFGELSNGFLSVILEDGNNTYRVLEPRQVDSGFWTNISGSCGTSHFLVSR